MADRKHKPSDEAASIPCPQCAGGLGVVRYGHCRLCGGTMRVPVDDGGGRANVTPIHHSAPAQGDAESKISDGSLVQQAELPSERSPETGHKMRDPGSSPGGTDHSDGVRTARTGAGGDQVSDEQPSALDEARRIVHGPRRESYGDPLTNHSRTAALWSAYLGTPVNARQVCVLNILQKISRDAHAPGFDNLVDVAGYAENAQLVANANAEADSEVAGVPSMREISEAITRVAAKREAERILRDGQTPDPAVLFAEPPPYVEQLPKVCGHRGHAGFRCRRLLGHSGDHSDSSVGHRWPQTGLPDTSWRSGNVDPHDPATWPTKPVPAGEPRVVGVTTPLPACGARLRNYTCTLPIGHLRSHHDHNQSTTWS